ncbi:cytochrome c3 family protein [Sandarakinorhabdus sp.]|uniref:cytochrome c3 family protein n=1 Tax=Sandarakinorhabdus sp. TaxID=1916663 RepID=UPI00334298FE
MSFIIRQVAKRADGGDIIRTRTLVTGEISVGRGTDCDIQLADLAVMLRHARLVQIAPGRVSVEATGGVPMQVAGKFVTRADVALADAPDIDIGPFRLSLSAGEDGAVAVTAQRVIAPVDSADATHETSIFSLQGAMPTRRRLAWAGALAVLIVMLILPLLHFMGEGRAVLPREMLAEAGRPSQQPRAFGLQVAAPRAIPTGGPAADEFWSTGTLSNAHASLSNNCGACHDKAFVSVTDSSCQACHTPAALPEHAKPARLATSLMPETGVIGTAHKAFNLPQGRCTSCHKEHEGEATVMTVAENYCTDCHDGMSSRLRDTKVVNVQNWPKHPDFRATLVAVPAVDTPQFRRAVLTGAREQSGLIYPHDIHQSNRNSVANMAQKQGLPTSSDGSLPCSYCHQPDSDKLRFKPIEMEANCGECHDLAFARDGDTIRTLPHGKPGQVAGIVRDFYLSQAIAPRAGVQRIAFERRLPGRMAEVEAAQFRVGDIGDARQRANAAVQAVFTGGLATTAGGPGTGICADCHLVSNTGAADITRRFAIAPVSINDHYLPKGQFPHGQHKSYDGKTGDAACVACHTGVMKSKLASDVLIPGVGNCRECHGAPAKSLLPTAAKAGDSCDTCHGFHEGSDATAPLPAGHGDAAPPTRVAARIATRTATRVSSGRS